MDAVKDKMDGYVQNVKDLSAQVAQLIEDQNDVGGVWTEIGGEWIRVAGDMQESIESLGAEVRNVLKEYDNLKQAQASTGGKSSNVEARAYGGPVKAGAAYDVGEYGKERFIPSTDGMIIPHNELNKTTKNRDIVDINLSMNGGEKVQLQGSNQSVKQLLKLFNDKKRYAA